MFFIGGVVSISYRVELFCVPFFLYFLLLCCVCFLFIFWLVVFVNTWQKGGEIVDMWESYLFFLGGIEFVFGRERYYVSCFTLLIDLYLWVIHDICLYCVLCEIKSLFLFTCIFHTCVYVFVECFRKYTCWFIRAAVYTCNW